VSGVLTDKEIEVMRLILMLPLLALAACDNSYDLTEAERAQTELGAREFADKTKGTFVSCSGRDSDGDKYVTCSVTDPAGATKELLCGFKARGCKSK
jgi:hypothetical protein